MKLLTKIVLFIVVTTFLLSCSHDQKEPNGLYIGAIRDKNKILSFDFRNNGVVYLEVSNINKFDENSTRGMITGSRMLNELLKEGNRRGHEKYVGSLKLSWFLNSSDKVAINWGNGKTTVFSFDGDDLVGGRLRLVKQ